METDGQTDAQTDEQTGANLMPPNYRHGGIKIMELWFLFSAHCLTNLYICTMFHENIDDRFKVMVDTIFIGKNSKGHNSGQKLSGVMFVFSLYIV